MSQQQLQSTSVETSTWAHTRNRLGIEAPQSARFVGRDLRERRLDELLLSASVLEGCDLRGASLIGVDLYRTRLINCDLRGTHIDANRLVEIWVPEDLPIDIVNQIRHFDFRFAASRWVAPNSKREQLPCPYRKQTIRPLLFLWGSRTWRGGAGWTPPQDAWTLEEIIAAVLEFMGCRHDLPRPYRLKKD